jgi:integrase
VIDAWKLARPPQSALVDRKTGQKRQQLICHRGRLVGKDHLNNKVLPAFCRKSGVPQSDSHGTLTSHRARATIATQLLNAREPLTLADLQQWLAHKHPASTRHYAAGAAAGGEQPWKYYDLGEGYCATTSSPSAPTGSTAHAAARTARPHRRRARSP